MSRSILPTIYSTEFSKKAKWMAKDKWNLKDTFAYLDDVTVNVRNKKEYEKNLFNNFYNLIMDGKKNHFYKGAFIY